MRDIRETMTALATIATLAPVSLAQQDVSYDAPTFDRWNYPFNGTPGVSTDAPTFGAVGVPQMFDDRDGQFLTSFITAGDITPGLGAGNYQILSATLTVTNLNDLNYPYDPTYDTVATYTGDADDPDAGRPVSVFGTGFRNGFDAFSYNEFGPFAFGDPTGEGVRNAYAAGFNGAGDLIDVSNNVRDGFDVNPWAVGQLTGVNPGDLVPAGAAYSFQLDISDPDIHAYLAEALNDGILSFTITSLSPAELGGPASYPIFFTKEHPSGVAATLDLSVVVIPAPATCALVMFGALPFTRRRRR